MNRETSTADEAVRTDDQPHELAGEQPTGGQEPRMTRRLRIYFAILSCLGGMMMGGGDETGGLPVIAIFFAVFGYVCVDWLKLFSLPPLLAYVAMAMAGLYCVSAFYPPGEHLGNRQTVVVAELLVIVQAVLMLQPKTQRIYEQISVFCLLQMIVAAVFNDAIYYGVLLVPIGILGTWSLSLLASLNAARVGSESVLIEQTLDFTADDGAVIQIESPEAQFSFERASRRIAWVASLTIAPAGILIGVIFFYALPRTNDASRVGQPTSALVGYSDQLQLRQLGQMLLSGEQALRIQLKDRSTKQPYKVSGSLYLRGKVLENYSASTIQNEPSATWSVRTAQHFLKKSAIPLEVHPRQNNERSLYDSVDVQVQCESIRSPSLFAISPYFRIDGDRTIFHQSTRWTLNRDPVKGALPGAPQARVTYRFGTHAFWRGVQSELTSRWDVGDEWTQTHPIDLETDLVDDVGSASSPAASDVATLAIEQEAASRKRKLQLEVEDAAENYLEECLQYDPVAMPSAARLAEEVYQTLPAERRNDYDFAVGLSRFLSMSDNFSYSLNLNAEPVLGMDPIEQFLSVDRRGHCQYFASAMAMMLRSQGVPSRLVVGYCTDEYNPLAHHYVARQLHAHVWVEALIRKDQLPEGKAVFGQIPSDEYWLRLDPTPGGGGGGIAPRSTAGVGQLMDMAQNFWKDYVVDMDGQHQEQAMLASTGGTPMSDAYGRMITGIQATIARFQASELGGGSLAGRDVFSWPAAVAGILLTLVFLVVARLKLPNWFSRQRKRNELSTVSRPSLAFYAEAIDQVSRTGIERAAQQTPKELLQETEDCFGDDGASPRDPFRVLTRLFYEARFGRQAADPTVAQAALTDLTSRIERLQNQQQDR